MTLFKKRGGGGRTFSNKKNPVGFLEMRNKFNEIKILAFQKENKENGEVIFKDYPGLKLRCGYRTSCKIL